ncbi:osmC-like protein [Seminavis robusta]|uniref:OsmC-like protein n=1 Tax=Seminavis robusta TaxID=568900 RepID=A0A9N8DWC7_9STRA|nr:osmC-like protein [Seminavis robusta]|eukprot:Sro296_g110770.1 osmC-like protein (559) ;mRNA; f:70435-72224
MMHPRQRNTQYTQERHRRSISTSLLLVISLLLLDIRSHGVSAAASLHKSSRKQSETQSSPRIVRGGSLVQSQNRRQLQQRPRGTSANGRRKLQDMSTALSNGYGGAGGITMDQVIPSMRPQATPITPEDTPPGFTPMPVPLPPVVPPTVAVPPPTPDNRVITFLAGNLNVMEGDLVLSQGLTSRIIAISGQPIQYTATGGLAFSAIDFHSWPDGAACFPDNRPNNPDGWIYVSNQEDEPGGVGAITFDANGNIVDYRMLLTGTTYNCNGGKTPWGSWISAEEDFDNYQGRPWQVDPYGVRAPVPINMGLAGGSYEAFAYDARNLLVPRFYLTEDDVFGALERFTPLAADWNNPWDILLGPGVNEWLLLIPTPGDPSTGTYTWTTDLPTARSNAGLNYPESEGIDVSNGTLFFVCKGIRMLFTLDLDGNTYTRQSTDSGLFEGEPDIIRTILSDEPDGEAMLYFTEDNGRRAGIHARNSAGELFTIVEGFYSPETTGLALSPNGKFLYFCFQEDGYCFAISRTDGLSFRAKTLNVKTHGTEVSTSRSSSGQHKKKKKRH